MQLFSCSFCGVVVISPAVRLLVSSPSNARTTSIKEMWRLPLVLVRLQRGLALRGTDKEIYTRFSAGKSQAELVAAIARALGTVVITHEAGDLQRVAHSIVLQPQTPFPAPKFRAPSPQTLPQGFVQSVLQNETARRPSRSASPASSPTTPPAALPHQQLVSVGSSGKRGLASILNLSGARRGSTSAPTSNPSSAASSVNSSPAGSRASSPSRGSRDTSPHPFPHPPLSPGVGFGDQPRTAIQRSSFGAHFSAMLSGRHSPVLQSNDKASDMLVKPPLGMMHTPRSPSDEHDDDEGLLGVSIEEGAVDVYPSAQVRPKGGNTRLAALRGRRRTFDVDGDRLPTSPVHNSVRTYPGYKDAQSAGAAAPSQHMRGGSGGTLSAILGLSSASNRVSPGAWAEDTPC
jgi:hypothetical protein